MTIFKRQGRTDRPSVVSSYSQSRQICQQSHRLSPCTRSMWFLRCLLLDVQVTVILPFQEKYVTVHSPAHTSLLGLFVFVYMVPQMHLEFNRQTVHKKRAPSICGSGQVLQACWGLIQVQPTPRANFPIKKRRRRKMLMFLLWDIISSLLVQIRASNPRLFSRKVIGLWCCCWPSLMSFVITNKTVLIHKSWSEGHAAKSRLLTGQEPILVPCCGKSTVLSSVPGLCFLRFYVLCCSEEPCSPGWSVAAGGTIIKLLLQPVFIKIFFTFFPLHLIRK